MHTHIPAFRSQLPPTAAVRTASPGLLAERAAAAGASVLGESELLAALRDAMAAVGLTLERSQLSPFERALAKEVERRVRARLAPPPADSSGRWWVAGQVIGCDDRDLTIHVEGSFQTPQQQRATLTKLCQQLNSTGTLFD